MPRSKKAWTLSLGKLLEPAQTARKESKAVLAHCGCSISAFMTAGTTKVRLGRSWTTACRKLVGSKRANRHTEAPAHKAGKV